MWHVTTSQVCVQRFIQMKCGNSLFRRFSFVTPRALPFRKRLKKAQLLVQSNESNAETKYSTVSSCRKLYSNAKGNTVALRRTRSNTCIVQYYLLCALEVHRNWLRWSVRCGISSLTTARVLLTATDLLEFVRAQSTSCTQCDTNLMSAALIPLSQQCELHNVAPLGSSSNFIFTVSSIHP